MILLLPIEIWVLTARKLPACDIVPFSRVSKIMHEVATQTPTFQVVSHIFHHKFKVESLVPSQFWITGWITANLRSFIKDGVERLILASATIIDVKPGASPGKVIPLKMEINLKNGIVNYDEQEVSVNEVEAELDLYQNQFYRIRKILQKGMAEIILYDQVYAFSTLRVCFFPHHYIATQSTSEGLVFYALGPSHFAKKSLIPITTIPNFHFSTATSSVNGEKIIGLQSDKIIFGTKSSPFKHAKAITLNFMAQSGAIKGSFQVNDKAE
jgi:hypothetical protein